jgi:hypothetical protein
VRVEHVVPARFAVLLFGGQLWLVARLCRCDPEGRRQRARPEPHSSSGVENTHVPVSKSSFIRNSSAPQAPGSTWTIIAPLRPSDRLTSPERPPQAGG